MVTTLRSYSSLLLRYGATAVGCYVVELQQLDVTLWSYSSWLLQYGATAVFCYVMELQKLVVTLWSYSSLLLRYGATAIGCYLMELQHFVVKLWSYSSLLLQYGATAICVYNGTELQLQQPVLQTPGSTNPNPIDFFLWKLHAVHGRRQIFCNGRASGETIYVRVG